MHKYFVKENAIDNITYQFSGGATSASVTGLPAGVTFVIAGNELTISGIPTGPFATQRYLVIR